MEEDILIKRRYSIPYELFGEAFRAFQKKFVYPRNMIMTLLLVLAAAANVVNIALGNGSTFGYVLIFVCLGLAGVNWYNPRKLRRSLMESIKGIENDVYVLTLYPDKMLIGTVLEPENPEEQEVAEHEEVFVDIPQKEDIAQTEIYLNNTVKIVEKDDFFMVYIKKSMFYIIPKKDFTEEEITLMNIHFGNQLYKNFICEVNK